MNWRTGFVALAAVLSGCINPFVIDPAKAVRDARDALQRGDNHLVGVCEFSCTAPGATPRDRERLSVEYIEHTSDVIVLLGQIEYNDRAREYATRYNRVILTPDE